jgi:hypothetical protein
MARIVDAQQAYQDLIVNFHNPVVLRGPQNRVEPLFSEEPHGQPLQERIADYYKGLQGGNNHHLQFRRDVALWYGAFEQHGTANLEVLRKVFAILYYGGLLYKRNNVWAPWHNGNIPIASAISHTARVVVQLPMLSDDDNANIWGWLNSTGGIQSRKAATHHFQYDTSRNPETVNHRPRRIKERKTWGFTGDHFYMNVALGGDGNRHPYSQKEIRADGHHGHLYLCYQAPTATRFGGLLIGVEQSASADAVAEVPHGRITDLKRAKAGVPDQYGGKHGLGGHNRYSATGGDDWTRGLLVGLGPDTYYDGLYVDLTDPVVYERVRRRAGTFAAANLGDTGIPLPPAGPRPPHGVEVGGPGGLRILP